MLMAAVIHELQMWSRGGGLPAFGRPGDANKRSETVAGPYELVGEAAGAAFTDVMLERDRRHFYVVQAYDASGIRSVYSVEASGFLPLFRIYLPLVVRN